MTGTTGSGAAGSISFDFVDAPILTLTDGPTYQVVGGLVIDDEFVSPTTGLIITAPFFTGLEPTATVTEPAATVIGGGEYDIDFASSTGLIVTVPVFIGISPDTIEATGVVTVIGPESPATGDDGQIIGEAVFGRTDSPGGVLDIDVAHTSDIIVTDGPDLEVFPELLPDNVGSVPTDVVNEDCSYSDLVELTPEDIAYLLGTGLADNSATISLPSNNGIKLNLLPLLLLGLQDSFTHIGFSSQPGDAVPLGVYQVLSALQGYQWQVATDESFSNLIVDGSLMGPNTEGIAHLPDDLLVPGVNYYFRIRFLSESNDVQEWSRTITLYIYSSLSHDPDEDIDGIFDDYAVNGVGFAGGKRLHNPVSGTVNELTVDLGTLKGVTVIQPSELPDSIETDRELPYGLFQFRVEDLPSTLTTPATVNVTIYLEDPLPADTRWFKFDPITQDFFDYTSNVQFFPDRVIISLTDGGTGDADGVVNGIIVDPGGPATSAAGVAVASTGGGGGGCSLGPRVVFDPTLLLLLLLVGFGVARKKINRVRLD